MSYAVQRNPAGLAATVAVHVALVGLAVAGLQVVLPIRHPLPPIEATQIPDAPKPPLAIRPPIVEQAITTDITPPSIDIDSPPRIDLPPVTTLVQPPGSDGPPVIDDARTVARVPAGETRSASIDRRYFVDFQPPYPSASTRAGDEGTVIVRVVIGTDGRVERATVARSSGHPRLDAAAIAQALARWRFIPALSDGRAVESERELPVTFRLMQG